MSERKSSGRRYIKVGRSNSDKMNGLTFLVESFISGWKFFTRFFHKWLKKKMVRDRFYLDLSPFSSNFRNLKLSNNSSPIPPLFQEEPVVSLLQITRHTGTELGKQSQFLFIVFILPCMLHGTCPPRKAVSMVKIIRELSFGKESIKGLRVIVNKWKISL